MATWIDTTDPAFNVLTDGKPVNAKTANYVINNIANNLELLYERVQTLETDASVVVDYAAPVEPGASVKVGMPVYWKISGSTGYWSPGYVSLLDTSGGDDTGDRIFHWQYDEQSFASGIVIRVLDEEGTTVDVALGGTVDFVVGASGEAVAIKNILPDDPAWADTFDNVLEDLFFNETNDKSGDVEDRTQSSFLDESDLNDPLALRQGVYFLSDRIGKLSPANQYTRVMGIMTLHATPEDDGATYTMRFVVCPEGLGGDKFHIHQKVELNAGLPTGYSFNPESLPDSWYPNVDEGGNKVSLNIAIGEIATTEVIYPYSELLVDDTPIGTTEPNPLYTPEAQVAGGGWLSASDAFFEDCVVPADALWGYAIQNITRFTSTAEEKVNGIFWKAPALYEHIILLQDGVPVPTSYYKVDASGIWWTQDGCEKSPIKHIITGNEPTGSLSLWYIAEFGDLDNGIVASVESSSLAVTNSGGVVTVDSHVKFLEFPLTPVLPFNPVDDLRLASTEDVNSIYEDGESSSKLMSADLVKYATDTFTALTNQTVNKSCRKHAGTWNTLTESGFWMVNDISNKPDDLNMLPTQYVFGLVGRSSSDDNEVSGTEYCYQMLIDPSSGHGMYLRMGTGSPNGDDFIWTWQQWNKFSNRVAAITLPGRTGTVANINYLSDTVLSFGLHESRYLISNDGFVDVVRLPSANSEISGIVWHTKEMMFINKMTPGSILSALVIHSDVPIDGLSGASYLISMGQSCLEAKHCMGRFVYTSTVAPYGVPNYLEYSGIVTAPAENSTLKLTSDCMAPQYYGDSTIRLTMNNNSWSVTGGTGVWFALTDEQYQDWVSGAIDNTVTDSGFHPAASLSALIGNKTLHSRAIKLSAMRIPDVLTGTSQVWLSGSCSLF